MADKTIPILIVDDYATMRGIIRNLLRQLGFEQADEAAGGEEALTLLRAKRYGLVICDAKMEPVSGLTLLKNIRADTKLKELPFLLVTSESKPESLMEAKMAGASNTLVKPFNAEMLKKKLESIFGPF